MRRASSEGATACANSIVLLLEDTEQCIVRAVTGAVLTGDSIERVLDTVFSRDAVDRLALETERHDLETQIANLTAAIKIGGDIPSLVTELQTASRQLRVVRVRLEPREQQDRASLRDAVPAK